MNKIKSNIPKISVVMSVYNGEKYLAEAIESILNQTYTNFEFIIVNDGSKDGSLEMIQKYMKKDERIVFIDRENKGLPYSLNEGISIAKGEYIARMDADDISLPSRFEKQIKYMEENKLDVCGTFMEQFKTDSLYKNFIKHPTTNENIRFTLSFFSCLVHPTVMLKKEVFDKAQYDENCKQAQDYQLWVDCAKEDFVFGNIPEILLNYRIHEGQVTISKAKNQLDTAHKIMRDYASFLGIKEKDLVEKIIDSKYKANSKDFKYILDETLKISNDKKVSDETLFEVFKTLYIFTSPKNPLIYYAYRKSTKGMKRDFKEELKLFLKSLFMFDRESSVYQGLKKIKIMINR